MPNLDWQTVIVTLIAAGAFAVLAWRLLPARMLPSKGGGQDPAKSGACAHCEPAASRAAQPTRTVTTPVVSLRDLRDTARQAKP